MSSTLGPAREIHTSSRPSRALWLQPPIAAPVLTTHGREFTEWIPHQNFFLTWALGSPVTQALEMGRTSVWSLALSRKNNAIAVAECENITQLCRLNSTGSELFLPCLLIFRPKFERNHPCLVLFPIL